MSINLDNNNFEPKENNDLNIWKCKTLIYGYNMNREKYNKYKNRTMEGLNEILDNQMFGEGETKCIGIFSNDALEIAISRA